MAGSLEGHKDCVVFWFCFGLRVVIERQERTLGAGRVKDAISESACSVAGDLFLTRVGVAGLNAQDVTQLGGVSCTPGSGFSVDDADGSGVGCV